MYKIFKIKRFSSNSILNINVGTGLGFKKERKYDQDLNRLQRGEVRRELSSGLLNKEKEVNKMRKELSDSNTNKIRQWRDLE